MKIFDEQTARVLATILVFVVVGAFIYGARKVLLLFVFAILFAYVLDPWIARIERWKPLSRGSRTLATAEMYVALLLTLALAIFLVAPTVGGEGRTLLTTLPSLLSEVSSGKIAQELSARHGWSDRTQLELVNFLQLHQGAVLSWVGSFAGQIGQLLTNSYWIVLVPILAFFFLRDGGRLVDYALATIDVVVPREFLAGVLQDLNEMMASYIRVQLILAGLALIFYMTSLSALRVPYALILGAIAGVLEFLPTIGPALATIMIVGVAFLAGYKHIIVLIVILGVWRIIQDYVTFPRLTGASLELHPLAAIFAILVGFEIGGVAGAYLSIPVIAGVRIVRMRWKRTYITEQAQS
jgi:predicted PurR-regulated permease PerM